jgi:hypothetical protein
VDVVSTGSEEVGLSIGIAEDGDGDGNEEVVALAGRTDEALALIVSN